MEDLRSVEDLGDYCPPDLPRNPDLRRKSGRQPDRCLDGQAAAVFTVGIWLWNPGKQPQSGNQPRQFPHRGRLGGLASGRSGWRGERGVRDRWAVKV